MSGYTGWQSPYGTLAGGGSEGVFLPFQLFAGESDITTASGVVAGGQMLAQYTVIGRRADGLLVAYEPGGSDEFGTVSASGTLTFTGPGAAGDTITIGAHTITLVAANPLPITQALIGASATLTAQAVKAVINSNNVLYGVIAGGTGAALTLTAEQTGVGGNAVALTKVSTAITVSAATLTGGAGPTSATGTVVLAQLPANGDTITVNGAVLTLGTYAAPNVGQVNIGVDLPTTAANIAAEINSNLALYGVYATVAGSTVTLTSNAPGAAGNGVALAIASTGNTISAASLAGGVDGVAVETASESRPIGILAQYVDASKGPVAAPYFMAGVFNAAALVWPAGLINLAAQQAAFDRTPIRVQMLK
jgi:hypothetical protein